MPTNHDQPDHLPQPLVDELRRTQEQVEIPQRVDRRVLGEAEQRLLVLREREAAHEADLARRRRLLHRRVIAPLAAAAALIVIGGVWFTLTGNPQASTPFANMAESGDVQEAAPAEAESPRPRLTARVAQPLEEDQPVDIRAAFALAKALQQGELAHRTWDVTADGRIDREDVDAIAGRAVSLASSEVFGDRAFPGASGRAGASPMPMPGAGAGAGAADYSVGGESVRTGSSSEGGAG